MIRELPYDAQQLKTLYPEELKCQAVPIAKEKQEAGLFKGITRTASASELIGNTVSYGGLDCSDV